MGLEMKRRLIRWLINNLGLNIIIQDMMNTMYRVDELEATVRELRDDIEHLLTH